MRERTQLFGGCFRAGPAPGQGFRVSRGAIHGDVVIRALLADDEELVRTGLRMILAPRPISRSWETPPTARLRYVWRPSSTPTCCCSI